MQEPDATLSLWDYRRRVAEMYAAVRAAGVNEKSWIRWRSARDELFRMHSQSPLPSGRRASSSGVPFFEYDPAWRLEGAVEPLAPTIEALGHSAGGATLFRRFATVKVDVAGSTSRLTLYWLDSYGGGVFLPFRDATNGATTYGGGRYLLDTAKGADLGHVGDRITLDFNFAYHPSCVHDSRWSCPLPPPGNRIGVPVEAGERL
jgi:uncharacterized protein (DUF1684 family)